MTNLMAYILAADDGAPVKVIFIVVAVAIWVIGSVVSSLRSVIAKQQAQKPKAIPRVKQPPLHLPALAQSHPNWKGGRTPNKPVAVRKPSGKRRPPPIPAKAPAAPEPEPIMMQVVDSLVASAGQSEKRQPTRAATAATLNRWLTPKTLRQQFMLTEVLRPPLALRADERE